MARMRPAGLRACLVSSTLSQLLPDSLAQQLTSSKKTAESVSSLQYGRSRNLHAGDVFQSQQALQQQREAQGQAAGRASNDVHRQQNRRWSSSAHIRSGVWCFAASSVAVLRCSVLIQACSCQQRINRYIASSSHLYSFQLDARLGP